MDQSIVSKIEKGQIKNRPDVKVGDTVKLSLKIKEAGRERIQAFEGVVISASGTGVNKTITVRKVSNGVGVERIMPLHSPVLSKIEIVKRGTVRRAKLYYMRDKVGKKAMEVTNSSGVYMTDGDDVTEESTEEVVAEEEAVVSDVEVVAEADSSEKEEK